MRTFQPEKIRQARLKAGLTQAQLARRAETTEKNIGRWEKGHNEPRAQHVAAIAAATGCDPGFFFIDEARREQQEAEDASEARPVGIDEFLRGYIRRVLREEMAA